MFQEATDFEASQFAMLQRDGGFGGGPMGATIVNLMRRLGPFLAKAAKNAPEFIERLKEPAQRVSDLAVSLGAGHGKRGGSVIGGSKMLGGSKVGGSALGGRKR